MMPYVEDDFAWPLMSALAVCLCTSIAEAELPEPCRCGVVPGPIAVMDFCGTCASGSCGGQAWVRLVTEFPSRDFPSPTVESGCVDPIAVTLEVGIARCQPSGSANAIRGYTPPTAEQQSEATRLQLADMRAIRRAIQCCLMDGAYADNSYVLGSYTPLQVSGDCGGGFYQVTVWSQ